MMNGAFGLLLWNVFIAALAMLLYVAVKRNWGGASDDRKTQMVASSLLIAGALLGLVPTLMQLDLFPGADLLLAVVSPMITLVCCGSVVVEDARGAKAENSEGGMRDEP